MVKNYKNLQTFLHYNLAQKNKYPRVGGKVLVNMKSKHLHSLGFNTLFIIGRKFEADIGSMWIEIKNLICWRL